MDWRNRIIGYDEMAPADLKPHPSNPRLHPPAQSRALAGALREVGLVQNVLFNKRTGLMLDGHLRVKLALDEGQATVPVTVVDLEPAEELLVLATLDPIGALAGVDDEALADLLAELGEDHDSDLQRFLNTLRVDEDLSGPQVEKSPDLRRMFVFQLEEADARVVDKAFAAIGGTHDDERFLEVCRLALKAVSS